MLTKTLNATKQDLLESVADQRFRTIMADPPWRFQNRSGKIAPEHKRLSRYETMTTDDVCALPIAKEAFSRARMDTLHSLNSYDWQS